MITSLTGYTDKFDKETRNNIERIFGEDVIEYLEENEPNPTLCYVLGLMIGAAFGLSLDDLTAVLDEDNFEEALSNAFNSIKEFMDDTGVTHFDKRV